MTLDLQPNYTVLTFFMAQKFGFFAVLCLLSGLRLIVGRSLARIPAGIAFVLAAVGLLTAFAPMLGLSTSALYVTLAQTMARGDGMIALLVPAAIFLTSFAFEQRRWRWIDWLHVLAVLVMCGLWWWVMS